MKKIFIPCLILICLLLTSCQISTDLNGENLSDAEYNRVGKEQITLRVPAPVSLNEAVEQAEMVVKVQITDIHGTYNYKSSTSFGVTVFSATILETYNACDKQAGSKIMIKQFGTPNETVMGFPLFKIGDEFLVCLEREDTTIYEDGYPETVYRIINDSHGILQEITVDGKDYIINRAHTKYCDKITDSQVDDSVRIEVLEALFDYDTILRTQATCPFEVYESNVIIEYLEDLK